jgi:hypothetical protein
MIDEMELLQYHCQICHQSYTSLAALNWHVRRDHPKPKVIRKSVFNNFTFGSCLVLAGILLLPGLILGSITTMITWELFPHWHAVVYGSAVFFAGLLLSFTGVYAIIAVCETVENARAEE